MTADLKPDLEPVAYYATDNYGIKTRVVFADTGADIIEHWRGKGWAVTPLYFAVAQEELRYAQNAVRAEKRANELNGETIQTLVAERDAAREENRKLRSSLQCIAEWLEADCDPTWAAKEARAALSAKEFDPSLAQPAGAQASAKQGEAQPFVVKHYTVDERPIIKGNGFDGLYIGESREEAEEFIAWVNARLAAPPAAPEGER